MAQVNRFLDIGTGTGKILKAVQVRYPNCECWGLDSNQAMLDNIEANENFILKIANVENLSGIPDKYFDLVIARMVFHHIKDVKKAAVEVKKTLKPGGIFVICEGNPPSVRSIDWYTEMFAYKEERNTLTEIDLVNIFVETEFSDITTKTIIMKGCSLNNWLENSGIPNENIKIIKRLHRDAPEYIKQDYNMIFKDNDYFMDWKFSITYGRK